MTKYTHEHGESSTIDPRSYLESLLKAQEQTPIDTLKLSYLANEKLIKESDKKVRESWSPAKLHEELARYERLVMTQRETFIRMAGDFLEGNTNTATCLAIKLLVEQESNYEQSTRVSNIQNDVTKQLEQVTLWAEDALSAYKEKQSNKITDLESSEPYIGPSTEGETLEEIIFPRLASFDILKNNGNVAKAKAYVKLVRPTPQSGISRKFSTRALEMQIRNKPYDDTTVLRIHDSLEFTSMGGLGASNDCLTEAGSFISRENYKGLEIEDTTWNIQQITHTHYPSDQTLAEDDIASLIKLVRNYTSQHIDKHLRQTLHPAFVNFNGTLYQVWETEEDLLTVKKLTRIPTKDEIVDRLFEKHYNAQFIAKHASKVQNDAASNSPEKPVLSKEERIQSIIEEAELEIASLTDEKLVRRRREALIKALDALEMEEINKIRKSGGIPVYEVKTVKKTVKAGISGTEKELEIRVPELIETVELEQVHPDFIEVTAKELGNRLIDAKFTYRRAGVVSSLDIAGIKGTGSNSQEKLEYEFRTKLQQFVNINKSSWSS